ncbi:MAG TPA: hypothetical protein VIG62_10625 [Blastocatellia bacterium]|jgi:hypothetical protein
MRERKTLLAAMLFLAAMAALALLRFGLLNSSDSPSDGRPALQVGFLPVT